MFSGKWAHEVCVLSGDNQQEQSGGCSPSHHSPHCSRPTCFRRGHENFGSAPTEPEMKD